MTKTTAYSLIAALLLVFMAAPALSAPPPQPAAAVAFGVIDTGIVMRTSLAAKSISSALDAKRKEFSAQISKEQELLRTAGQKFEKEQASLKKEEIDARRKKLNEQLFTLQKKMQSREMLLDKALNESLGTLRKETRKVVEEIALERKLSAVLTQDAVMLSVSQMDITPEVLKRLNARVKEIPINWKEIAKDAAQGKKAG